MVSRVSGIAAHNVRVSRRAVLTGVAAAGGLAVGWLVWPRRYPANLTAAPGETIFNPWLKIGQAGNVVAVVPQVEMGQGSYTAIAQIMADELGADWRTMGVEPAPINAAYANTLIAAEWGGLPDGLQVTGEATTVRGFEPIVRQAAAAARALLCMAAAKRWDADWRACDTANGFVVRGDDRLRFGDLAEEAAGFDVPDAITLRSGSTNRITGRGVNRLDAPAKIDGSMNFAADVRLPDLVFAAIRQGPPGDSRLISADKAAADRIAGVLQIVEHERWVAAVASNWWAANRALDALRPRFASASPLVDDKAIDAALRTALAADGKRIAETGDIDAALASAKPVAAEYSVGPAAHAAIEPVTATAAIRDGTLQLWLPTHWAGVARDTAAKAIGFGVEQVVVHATQAGGSFGRKYETAIAAQAAILALKVGRPVQLTWSRTEDLWQDPPRPPARAKLTGVVRPGGRIEAWKAAIAAPDGLAEMRARAFGKSIPGLAPLHAVDGAVPPYALPAFALDHHAVETAYPWGQMRGGADGASCFFTECFVDELAAAAGTEPFSFRMAMLGSAPRLALCLSKAAAQGGWQGAVAGSGQGIACHSMRGSHVAVLAEAYVGDNQRVRVTKLVCVADLGRVINPDLARQQIEGGLVFGMALATARPMTIARGLAAPTRLGAIGLPRLADMPEISVELVASREPPGGASDVAVPPVGPAIANALHAATGRRFRALPLMGG